MRSRQSYIHLRIRNKADPIRVPMEVIVKHLGEELRVDSADPISINEVLSILEIPPSTVLAVQGDRILPHTSMIKSDATLELVVVSSGG